MSVYWFILSVHPARERITAREINRMGHHVYVPMDIRSHAVVRPTRRRVITETPLIPRCVFVAAPHSAVQAVSELRWAIRVARDENGRVSVISDSEMARFMAGHAEWLDKERKRHQSGERRGGKRRKAKVYKPTAADFAAIKSELFGITEEAP